MIGNLLLYPVLIIIAGTGVCCFAARFADSLRQVLANFFALIHTPFQRILDGCGSVFRNIRQWIGKELKDESVKDEGSPTYFCIGAVLYTILTVLFLFCDLGISLMTLEALGLEKYKLKLPLDASSLTALTLLSTSLFWGMILFDILGVTHVAPWRKVLSRTNRQIMTGLSMAMIGIAVAIVIILGYWRGESMSFVPEVTASVPTVQDNTGFKTFGSDSLQMDQGSMNADSMDQSLELLAKQEWVAKTTMMSIAALSCISTAPAAVGLIKLFKFLTVMFVFILNVLLLPVAGLAWLMTVLSNMVFAFVQSLLDLLVSIGSTILRQFGYEAQPTTTNEASVVESQDQFNDHDNSEDHMQSRDPGFNPFNWRQ